MGERVWSGLVFGLRITAVVFVGLVTLGIFLSSKGVITISPGIDSLVWGIGLAVIAVDNVGTLFTRSRAKKRRVRNENIDSALMSILIMLSKSRQVRFEELGASVYVVARRNPREWFRAKEVRLKRIRRYRPGGFPQQSGIAWTENSGTVGQAWRDRKTIYWNGVTIAKKHGQEKISALTPEIYTRIAKSTRQGFTLDQFKAIAGKYAEVIATPIWDQNKERTALGILTVDRAYVQGDDYATRVLTSPRTRETVETAARQLGTQLRDEREG